MRRSITLVVGRSIQIWVDSERVLLKDTVTEEHSGWSMTTQEGLEYVGLKFPIQELLEGRNPMVLEVHAQGHGYHPTVDVVVTPGAPTKMYVHGEEIEMDETQILIHATRKGAMVQS